MSDPHLGYLFAFSALLLFTVSIMVTKLASSRIPLALGFVIATVVNVAFAGLALLVQLALSDNGLHWNTRAFFLFAAAGVFSTYLGRWFFYESVVRFGPAKASIFQVSSPLFTALMAWLLMGEQLTALVALGMFMAIGGLTLVSYKPGFFARRSAVESAHGGAAPSFSEFVLRSAFLLGVGSSFAYAVGNVMRGLAIRSWPEPILGALVGAAFGLMLHVGFSPDKAGLVARLRSADRKGAWQYVLIGICNISAQAGVIAAMRFIPLSVVTLITLCTPVFVFPASHFLFKTKGEFTVATLLGSAIALLGVAIIVMR
ncbi:MAG: DMT family transporter [Polaromonas sp.]|nr:DMT family transporter [Polaromonas sp.]